MPRIGNGIWATFRGFAVFRHTRIFKTRWLLSILLMSGIVGVGITGIHAGTSGANSGKVYVAPAPWGKVAPPKEKEAKTIEKPPVVLVERKKQADSKGKKYDLPSPWTAVSPSSGNRKSAAAKIPAPKKMYTTTSPWTIIETKQAQSKIKKTIPPKPQKVFASASPWTTTEAQEKSYVVKKLPKPEKTFRSASPWAKAAPANGTKVQVAKHSAVTPPNSSRIIACDLRLVRVLDGKVVSQVSVLDSYANIKNLAEVMVGRLQQESLGGSVVMMTLCNRRGTRQGQLVGREMSENVTTALKNASGFKFVRILNLREILPTEQTLECAKDVTAPRFRVLFNGAEYVLIGGVALNKLPHVTLQSANARTTGSDLH
jgi:hypothetical protein